MDMLFGKFVKQPLPKTNIATQEEQPDHSDLGSDLKDQCDQVEISDQLLDQPKDQLLDQESSNLASADFAPGAKNDSEPVQSAPGAEITPGAGFALAKNTTPLIVADVGGHTAIPHIILDSLLPKLSTSEQSVYLRLYRLSYGFKTDTCKIGFPKLATTCNISRRQAINCVERLESLGLIEKLGSDLDNKSQDNRGNIYKVKLPLTASATNTPRADNAPGAKPALSATNAPIKDHDHDHVNKDHHQSEVMKIYQTFTGNKSWTKSDQAAYEKLKHLSINEISNLIKSTLEKAHQKPASLAYFVKAYQNPNVVNPNQKQVIKAKIAAIVKRKREAHVGAKYTISDLTYDVKAECVREGIVFDNDLFNEVLEKK